MAHRVAMVVFCLVGMMLACGGIGPDPPPPISREQFRSKVIGKTEQEVIDAVGQPQTRLTGKDSLEWIYHRRTIDPKTKETDETATIAFDRKKGKVSSISFR